MSLETRNITDNSEWVWLSTRSESPYFNAAVFSSRVLPRGAEGKSRSWVLISCAPDISEGTVGYVKLTGSRGSESYHLWLKATALSSLPGLELSRSDLLLGQGYRDPVR